MAQVVRSSAIWREEVHCVVLREVLRILLNKVPHCIPERRDRLHVFQHGKRETWMAWRLSLGKALAG